VPPRHFKAWADRLDNLLRLRRILLNVGINDGYHLHWGHRLLSHYLCEAGIAHEFTENSGTTAADRWSRSSWHGSGWRGYWLATEPDHRKRVPHSTDRGQVDGDRSGRSYGRPGSNSPCDEGYGASGLASATSDSPDVNSWTAYGESPGDEVAGGGDDHSPTVFSGAESTRRRDLLRATVAPMMTTPADRTRMGNAAAALSSAAVWHSWTNADHWARLAGSVAAGCGPAPIVFGPNKATIAASDPCPGPQVPPAAGLGRAISRPVIAKAAPKRPRQTNMSLVHQITVGRFTQNHPSRSSMVGGGLHCEYAHCTGPWLLPGIRALRHVGAPTETKTSGPNPSLCRRKAD
jgi:hypothetical protein